MGGSGSGSPKTDEERRTQRIGISVTKADRSRLLALCRPGETLSQCAYRLLLDGLELHIRQD
jgi:hypothetical protein